MITGAFKVEVIRIFVNTYTSKKTNLPVTMYQLQFFDEGADFTGGISSLNISNTLAESLKLFETANREKYARQSVELTLGLSSYQRNWIVEVASLKILK